MTLLASLYSRPDLRHRREKQPNRASDRRHAMLINGKCHCGNLSFALDWPGDAPRRTRNWTDNVRVE